MDHGHWGHVLFHLFVACADHVRHGKRVECITTARRPCCSNNIWDRIISSCIVFQCSFLSVNRTTLYAEGLVEEEKEVNSE